MKYLALTVLVIVAVCVLIILTTISQQSEVVTVLQPNRGDLTVVSLLPGETRQGKIEFLNSASEVIEIEAFRTSCQCTTLEFPRTILPGALFSVSYLIHVNPSYEKESLSISIQPVLKGKCAQQPCDLRIEIEKSNLHAATPTVDGGEVIFGVPVDVRSEISSTDYRIVRLSAKVIGESELFGRITFTQKSNNRFEVFALTNEALDPGVHHATVSVNGHDVSGAVLSRCLISFSFLVVHDVEAIPSAVDFGMIGRGMTPVREVILKSRTQTPFSSSVDFNNNAIVVQSIDEATLDTSGSTYRVSVRSSNSIGDLSFAIDFQITQGGSLYVVQVPVHFYQRESAE